MLIEASREASNSCAGVGGGGALASYGGGDGGGGGGELVPLDATSARTISRVSTPSYMRTSLIITSLSCRTCGDHGEWPKANLLGGVPRSVGAYDMPVAPLYVPKTGEPST